MSARKVKDKPYSRIGWETIRKRYSKPMMAIMQGLYRDFTKHYPELHAEEPFEMDADMYSVNLSLRPEGRESIDVSLEIVESQDYEGIAGGYTFRLDVVEYGGRILGGCSPFNYTEQVWCKTLPAIKERFELLKPAVNASEIAALVLQ